MALCVQCPLFFSFQVSFKALVCSRPFCPDYEIDQSSGNLRKSSKYTVLTVSSRLRDLWSHVSENRATFERSSDTGLIPKSVARYWNKFINYVLVGAVGTLFYALVLPPVFLLASTLRYTSSVHHQLLH